VSFFGSKPSGRGFLLDRGVILLAVALAALVWAGLLPPLSTAVWQLDAQLRDELSLFLPPTRERDDLVFLGINEESRKQESIPPGVRTSSRALTLMRENVGNETLDRRLFADVIRRLADAGARQIIFDVVFVGAAGDPKIDREFAETLLAHHSRVILASILVPKGNGAYHMVDPRRELPGLSRPSAEAPNTGYVNLWPDAPNGVIRRMIFETTRSGLEGRPPQPDEPVLEALSTVGARSLGAEPPPERSSRLRFAVASESDAAGREPRFADAYAPRGLHTIFDPGSWSREYRGGAWFRDKVVLISTSTFADDDLHRIPGAVVHGGQIHLQALGCLLEDSFWNEVPRWAEVLLLLVMAGVGTILVFGLRSPAVMAIAMLAIAAALVVASAFVSGLTGYLFAGTPGVLGLLATTIFGGTAHTIARWRRESS